MMTHDTSMNLAQREAITDRVATELSTDLATGLKSLRSYDSHESQDLKRDLLAMAWRVALKSDDPAVRQALANYLLEAVASGTPFLQGQAVKFLQDFSPRDFDQQATAMLQALPLSGDYASERIRLIGIAGVEGRTAVLREAAGTNWNGVQGDSLYASREWAASLALARFGDVESTKRIIEQVKNEPNIILRATKLFTDLAYTRQPAAFDALRDYLHSHGRLPQIKDSVPGTPEAVYAATLFAKHAEGCPITSEDVYEKDVATIRQWADVQASWRFRE